MVESPGNFAVVELVHLCGDDGRDVQGLGIETNGRKGIGEDGTRQIKFFFGCGRTIKFRGKVAFLHDTDGLFGVVVDDAVAGVIEEKIRDQRQEAMEPVQSQSEKK